MFNLITLNYRKIYELLPPHKRKQSIVIAFLLLVSSALDLLGLGALLPLIILVLDPEALNQGSFFGDLYLKSGLSSTTMFLIVVSAIILLIVVLKNLMSVFIQYLLAKFTFSIQEHFSNLLLQKYFHRGLSFIKASNSNRVARDVNGVPNKFSTNLLLPLLNLTNEVIIFGLIVIALLIYNPWVVGLVLLIVLPTFLIFYRFSKNKVQYYAERMFEINPMIAKTLYESFFGYTDIKVSGTAKKFQADYEKNLHESLGFQVLNQTFKAAPTKVIETSMILGILSIICFGLYYYDDRGSLLTLLSVFALVAYRVLPSANRLMIAVIEIRAHQYTLDVLDRVNNVYKEENQDPSPVKFHKEIQFNNVTFQFEDKEDLILDGLSLKIKKGERLGVIGKSGSGKSTLMNLLLLFYEPSSGSINCDGLKLDISKQEAWRKLIGYVPQEVFLNDGNIRENVAFGVEEGDIDDALILQCLERASLKDLLDSLPDRIYSSIGERGSRLSGGQRQRLGIARALYFGAEILLFDEATSALDSGTEKEITDSINKLAEEHITMLIIAHRITSLKHCSRIVEMEEGKLVGEYSFEQLIKEYS